VNFIVTTNPGIEDLALKELHDILGDRILNYSYRPLSGRIYIEVSNASLNELFEDFLKARMIHRFGVLLYRGKVGLSKNDLSLIKDKIRKLDPLRLVVNPSFTFAIRAERAGKGHEYTSLDVARIAGDAVIDYVVKEFGERVKVDLDYPNVIIHVDVINDDLYVYVGLSGDMSLHRRGYRVYDHPAALKPTIAYAMILLSSARDGDVILDPMCGGGTIPIEAALTFESSEIICMDISEKYIRGAYMNAVSAMVSNRIKFIVGDARKLSSYVGEVDRIVVNPPYGIKLGDMRHVRRVYRDFLAEVPKVLSDNGRLVMITPEYKYVERVVSELKTLRIIHERTVSHGNLWPKIIVIEKAT